VERPSQSISGVSSVNPLVTMTLIEETENKYSFLFLLKQSLKKYKPQYLLCICIFLFSDERYPKFVMTQSKPMMYLKSILALKIPAQAKDLILILKGKKPRFVKVLLFNKIVSESAIGIFEKYVIKKNKTHRYFLIARENYLIYYYYTH
jgi:hypothetical protein